MYLFFSDLPLLMELKLSVTVIIVLFIMQCLFYYFFSDGWVRDRNGQWVKDENVEFDSDEEEPAPLVPLPTSD